MPLRIIHYEIDWPHVPGGFLPLALDTGALLLNDFNRCLIDLRMKGYLLVFIEPLPRRLPRLHVCRGPLLPLGARPLESGLLQLLELSDLSLLFLSFLPSLFFSDNFQPPLLVLLQFLGTQI